MEKKREITFTTKKKGKEIMVFEFFIPIRRLHVPDSLSNHQLFQDKDWPLDKNQNSRFYYTKLLKYGKNNY